LPPLALFTVPRSGSRRISVVTDSISKGSLMGGVGTALIVAAALARQRGARLRLVTRSERAQPAALDNLFRLYGVSLQEEIEFAFANMWVPGVAVDTFPDELFITTSWWTTHATLTSVPAERVLYLLQEDERMFYEGGDKLLRCTQLLANDRMHVAVNTQGLLDHLVGSGLPHLARTARAFEPAFPPNVYSRRAKAPGSKRRFMFYARPEHPRNIFYFGLEVLDRAVAQGVLDPDRWDIVLVGSHIPAFTFCDGTQPRRLENLPWNEYAEFAGGVDLALSLMYTPHPSYPPFDLAASGAVVVTNRFGNKTDLSDRCGNIFMAELEVESMLATLREASARVDDEATRQAHYASRRLPTDWAQTLTPVVLHFGGKTDVWA
jgi:O-antigen biosynthesis protein